MKKNKQRSLKIVRIGCYLVFIFLILWACFGLWHEESKVTHFETSIMTGEEFNPDEIWRLNGQYKTNGEGFIAGENITIELTIKIPEERYNIIKNLIEKKNPDLNFMYIENSEPPDQANKDLSNSLKEGVVSKVNNGMLKAHFLGNNTIYLEGDVVFTRETDLRINTSDGDSFVLGTKLNPILSRTEGVHISPRHVKNQIESIELSTALAKSYCRSCFSLIGNFTK
ncbi:MAG: hypothetical protein BTN85_0267 [Candidatus Methanohalarchaeum thermophilum]|uniref:Uncharacterized protein n=1 Tax=Methanohalarchaeum thermophilum TaxID=1903181 RepID=A0A1Q6DTW3_METT1|nr:MAG: hypothetical protein BTN85_0267 [Candidatus Methanohalarchaeum thermophilum]